MMEHETSRVQERAIEAEHGPKVAGYSPAEPTVRRIADDRMSDFAQMHAYLMCAPGFDFHIEESEFVKAFSHSK